MISKEAEVEFVELEGERKLADQLVDDVQELKEGRREAGSGRSPRQI